MIKTEQLGPYSLSWPDGVFPLGGDALALGEFATVKPRWRICDLGTGSGALLLLLARREEGLSLTGIDIDPLSARTARENLAVNGLEGRILTGDLRTAPLPAGGFDLAVSNPPYFPTGSGRSGGPAGARSCALWTICAPPPDGSSKTGGASSYATGRNVWPMWSVPSGPTAWSRNGSGWSPTVRTIPPPSCWRRQ